MNISAPFIRRPVGTALLTAAVASKVEEVLAEKWGQKDKQKIDFSAPIFLPFPPALLLQGHELNSVPSQVEVNDVVTKSAQFILRIKGVAHDPIVNLRELFLVCRAHADKGCNRHKVMAEKWGQKNQKEIHFSAPIFLPPWLHSL